MISKPALILIILQLLCIPCNAQRPDLYFRQINSRQGLSNNKVNCILQDKRNFIWIGTDDGLNRYDGNNFTVFRNIPGNGQGISGNVITALYEDSSQVLWVATADGGLSKYNYRLPVEKQFVQYKNNINDSNSIPVNIINDMLEDDHGFLWLATSGRRVIRFNKKTGKFDQPVKEGPTTALAICRDHENNIWVGRQGGGLLKINPVTGQYDFDRRYQNLYSKLPHMVVTSLFRDSDHNMWFGSWDKVLYHYDHLNHTETVFQQDAAPGSFPNDEISDFAEDSQHRIWMAGRYGGLHVYDKKSNVFYNYLFNAASDGGIADNEITSLFIDRNDNLWVGTKKGVCISNLKQRFIQQFLPAQSANTIIYDFFTGSDKKLWIATSNGIFTRERGSREFNHYPVTFNEEQLHVTKLFEDYDGSLYIGTNYSLFRYNEQKKIAESLPDEAHDKVMEHIIESRVVSVLRDTIDGNPVLLTAPYGHYLAYYDLQQKKWISRLDSSRKIITSFNLADNLIRKFHRSGNGSVWFAMTKEGMGYWQHKEQHRLTYFRNNPEDSTSISCNRISDICDAAGGNLWVSTYGGGLNHFYSREQKFSHISSSANLLEGINTDRNGKVWMIGNGMLHSYDPSKKLYSTYELPDIEKSGGVKGNIYKDPDGLMYIAGQNYFITFRPEDINEANYEPEVIFTGFRIFNKQYDHLVFSDRIDLSYTENFFTIEFASPYYQENEKIHYSYMLEGVDKDWVDAGSRNFASYPNIGNGSFVFKVKASVGGNVGSGKITRLIISVSPPFWKQWWFLLLLAAIFAATAYFLYSYRIRELLKRQAMRNKIAQDLHDNIGSTLSSISVYSHVAQIQNNEGDKEQLNEVLGKISDTSSDMIGEMNDIVWAINPRNDSMEKIILRMKSFAMPLAAAKNIELVFNSSNEINKLNMDMEQRKNLYLIFKEAVNNTVKYSEATKIEVNLMTTDKLLTMEISDNGIGFNIPEQHLNKNSTGGNGLGNMHERAKQVNGKLEITSYTGKGTVVRFEMYI